MMDIRISRNKEEMDLDLIHQFLSQKAYWALGRTKADVLKSMENSICFGVFREFEQIAFARIVTDRVVFGWVMDFFVVESEQKMGVGEYLLSSILEIPELENVNGLGLRTKDAHNFYAKYGFEKIPHPDTWMLKRNLE